MSAFQTSLSLVPENGGDLATLCQICEGMFQTGKRRGRHHTETGVGGLGVYAVFPENYFCRILYDQPLSGRAWCFQERIFPPRLLGFGLGKLSWSCNGSALMYESFSTGLWISAGTLEVQLKRVFESDDPEVLQENWRKVLREYISRNLTYPEVDKLAAISALATRMGQFLDDVYIVGHFWKSRPMRLN